MLTCKEYRAKAAAALKGHYGLAIGVTIVYSLIISFVSSFAGIGLILTGGAFEVGLAMFFMNIVRGGAEFGDMFYGFSKPKFDATIGLYIKSALLILAWSLLFCIPGIIAIYRYAMAPYIMADHPEMSGIDCIRASKELMKGKKGKLFCLELSYIGWVLLGCLTCGILMLWVVPKMEAAKAAFYESIKGELAI